MIDFIRGYVKHVRDHLHFRAQLKRTGVPMNDSIGLFVNKDGDFVYASPLLSPKAFWQMRKDFLKSLARRQEVKRLVSLPPTINNPYNNKTTH